MIITIQKINIEFGGKWLKYLMRGDADGRITLWKIPDTPECASMQLKTDIVSPFSVLNCILAHSGVSGIFHSVILPSASPRIKYFNHFPANLISIF